MAFSQLKAGPSSCWNWCDQLQRGPEHSSLYGAELDLQPVTSGLPCHWLRKSCLLQGSGLSPVYATAFQHFQLCLKARNWAPDWGWEEGVTAGVDRLCPLQSKVSDFCLCLSSFQAPQGAERNWSGNRSCGSLAYP